MNMTEIKFKITEDIPADIIKFLIERELDQKISKIKKIKKEIESLSLTEEDINKFERARQEAWNDLKKGKEL